MKFSRWKSRSQTPYDVYHVKTTDRLIVHESLASPPFRRFIKSSVLLQAVVSRSWVTEFHGQKRRVYFGKIAKLRGRAPVINDSTGEKYQRGLSRKAAEMASVAATK